MALITSAPRHSYRESQDETKLQPRVTTALLATQAGGASISSAIAQGSQPGADRTSIRMAICRMSRHRKI